jgi:hypothetical protein
MAGSVAGAAGVVVVPQADRMSMAASRRLRKLKLNFLDDILFLLVYENLRGLNRGK